MCAPVCLSSHSLKSRFLIYFLFLLSLVSLLLHSCTIEKRQYRNGFYIDWNHTYTHTQDQGNTDEDTAEQHPLLKSEDPIVHVNVVSIITQQDSVHENTRPGAEEQKANPEEKVATLSTVPAERIDEPQPPGNDRVNPKITGLVIAGMVFSLLFALNYFVPLVGSAPYFFILAPLLGVVLFAAAMYLRQKYALRAAAGEKNEALRLSAHFHRFRVMLYLFFIASLAMGIGYLFAFSVSGIASGVLGIVLGGGGMVLVQGVGIVLLILGLIYLFRWRKDPTGYKPPRIKRPPKDG